MAVYHWTETLITLEIQISNFRKVYKKLVSLSTVSENNESAKGKYFNPKPAQKSFAPS